MLYIFYIVMGAFGIMIAVWLIRGMTTKGFARTIAKTNLRSFIMLKNKYPNKNPEELYIEMIKQRPTYNEGQVKDIIKRAKENIANAGKLGNFLDKEEGKGLRLWVVILELIIYEYQRLNPSSFSLKINVNEAMRFAQKMKTMKKEVLDIVSIDL